MIRFVRPGEHLADMSLRPSLALWPVLARPFCLGHPGIHERHAPALGQGRTSGLLPSCCHVGYRVSRERKATSRKTLTGTILKRNFRTHKGHFILQGEELGAWLKRSREAIKKSAEQIAAEIGVSAPAVYGWERGTIPKPERFPKMEAAYGLPAGSIAAVIGGPLTGGSLSYWVGRFEQATVHLERVTREQRDLVDLMRASAAGPAPTYEHAPPIPAAHAEPQPLLPKDANDRRSG